MHYTAQHNARQFKAIQRNISRAQYKAGKQKQYDTRRSEGKAMQHQATQYKATQRRHKTIIEIASDVMYSCTYTRDSEHVPKQL